MYSEIKSRISTAREYFFKKTLGIRKMDLNLRKILVKCYSCSWNMNTSKSRSQSPGKFGMWCWKRMDKISWTDHVISEVLKRVKGRSILQTVRRRKTNWIGHILRRNCFLKRVIEGKIEGRIEAKRRRGRRRKQLLQHLWKREDTVNWKTN
jgi:hypothetical protein